MSSLVDLINEKTVIFPPFGRVIVIVALFGLAWLLGRGAGRAAALVARDERQAPTADPADSSTVAALHQRETAVSLARTSVAFFAYAVAFLLSLGVLIGADRVETLVGASFIVILFAFTAQRFLLDVIAGLLMFNERWFQIGDTVVIEPWNVAGVVENLTLRTVTVRGVGGDVMRVTNSQVRAVRVLPRGYRKAEIELFVTDAEAGRQLVKEVASIVPRGPTHFIRAPLVTNDEALDDDLYRIRALAAVPLSREWLANDLLPNLIRERAPEDLVVHGPVVMWADEHAERRFARATRLPLPPDPTQKPVHSHT